MDPVTTRISSAPTGATYGLIAIFLFIGIVMVPGVVATIFGSGYMSRMREKKHPASVGIAPWVFAFVWAILYLLIWISGFYYAAAGIDIDSVTGAYSESLLASTSTGNSKGVYVAGLILYTVTHALNIAWSPVFFGMRKYTAALVIVSLMFLCAIATTILFYFVSYVSGALITVYPLWLGFAVYLNARYVHYRYNKQKYAKNNRGRYNHRGHGHEQHELAYDRGY